jgi:hypothetical protein
VSSSNESVTTQYGPGSNLLDVALGSGLDTDSDSDSFSYDSFLRMTAWTFKVGSSDETGAPTWNANGSLGSVAINDGFNSGGTQTCNFGTSGHPGYDDVGRLIYDDCGSGGWGQYFSYDNNDNITKQVIAGRTGITFIPGYNTANNQIPSETYDSNGNVSDDSFNHYTFNQFNRMASVNLSGSNCSSSGQCMLYDASGRVVEIDNGGTHTEILYTQLGKTAFLNGTTLIMPTGRHPEAM